MCLGELELVLLEVSQEEKKSHFLCKPAD